jgi:hypothetical protein
MAAPLRDRRTSQRLQLFKQLSCVVRDEQDGEYLASVRDISMGGIGLTFCFQPSLETLLPIGMPNSRSHRPHQRLMRVTYAQPSGEFRWQGGGHFLRPLSQKELWSILERVYRG